MERKYVYVIYDPLYEKVICVHDKPDKLCRSCIVLDRKRIKKGEYQLEEFKRLIQTNLK